MADWNAVGSLATAVGVFIAVGTGIAAYFGVRKQLRLQVLLQYTERYENVMDLFPRSIRTKGIHRAAAKAAQDQAVLHAFLKYSNLCSEEFYFHGDGYVAENAWKTWQGEMRTNFRSPLGRACWKLLRDVGHYQAYSNFVRQVEDWLREKGDEAPVKSSTSLTARRLA